MSLFWRVFAINAAVLTGAFLLLLLTPATVSRAAHTAEIAVLAVGVVAALAVSLVLMRRTFGPLERLARTMDRIDPLQPGRRVETDGKLPEVAAVTRAFNAMLGRLESERRDSARRLLLAQEAERGRIARDLHDEVGQTLTGVVLQLEALARVSPPDVREQVVVLQESARAGLEEVRAIARGLRPEALDDFGLHSALVTLAAGFADASGIAVRRRIDADLPDLARESELVIYRVAQESLTNVMRHAGARQVELALERVDDTMVLRVRDDGSGVEPAAAGAGAGVKGMRERAMLVGGHLEVARIAPHGTEVRLEVPAG